MSLLLTRTLAYFTLICYLVVGTVAVRFFMPQSISVAVSTSYLEMLNPTQMPATVTESLVNEPQMAFADIVIPVEKKVAKAAPVKVVVKLEEKLPEVKAVAKNELPFHEPITLSKISFDNELPVNLVASYKDFTFQETLVAENVVADEVTTAQASTQEAEPEFFEYPAKVTAEQPKEVAKIAPTQVEKQLVDNSKNVDNSDENVEIQNVAELVEESPVAPVMAEAQAEPQFFDYPTPVTTQAGQASAATSVATTPTAKSKEVAVADLVAFDYSRARQDVVTQTIPTVSKVTTHKSHKSKSHKSTGKHKGFQQTDKSGFVVDGVDKSQKINQEKEEAKATPVEVSYPVNLTINALGSDLKQLEKLQGFEVRFQDDLSEMLEDYGAGEVRFEAQLSKSKMTRSITLLKRGFTPTSTEVILEEGETSVSIPMLQDEIFNELQHPFERKGTVGALLVELDDETEVAKLDVPFGQVVKLDGDFKRTEKEDFRYQLFVGVQAGNALLSYHRTNGEVLNKIVHVHEHEVTYDANFYEDVVNEKVRLYEEDLLAKENSPLIISADQVRVFATEKTSKKINNHTYKLNMGVSHLGGRRYLELNHHNEPVFVGIRDNNHVTVPSENFMRFILSSVEGKRLGNRCLVQINLDKKIEKFEIASESVSASLMTYAQVLDNDGKFYDSASEKTRKIIVIGESQGSRDISPDAKINVKINYQDGTVQFLNSYCSPNTYLVEQL